MAEQQDLSVMARLAAAIEQVWGGWTGPLVEESVFGSRDPRAIAASLVGWSGAHLGAPAVDVLWYHASVGCSAALVLADGRRVVLKAHQPRFGAAYLRAMADVQRHLHECWFPCPEPIGPIAALGTGDSGALVSAALLRPEVPAEGEPDIVAAAATLARLTSYLDGAEYLGIDTAPLAPHPLQVTTPGSLYPEPYSPAIVFADAGGDVVLREIDRLAAGARAVMVQDATPQVVTHIDWCTRNVRGDAAGVTAVFDMDSLALLPEARAVGTAAVSWCLANPTADGALDRPAFEHFVWAHQRVRDYWFDEAGMRAVRATALWNLAYTARCEHALGAPSVATASLRQHGESLLA